MRGLYLVFCFLMFSVCNADNAPNCNRPNEILDCTSACPPERTCKTRTAQYKCMHQESCETKCICKEGYFRNAIGECISEKDCDRCPGNHEYFSCGSECDNVCSTLHVQNQTHCPILNIQCNRKCYCEPGYARNDKNECVPFADCNNEKSVRTVRRRDTKDQTCSGPNEKFSSCKRTCPPETCLSLVAKFNCLWDKPCTEGCICKPGFLRKDAQSPCMPLSQCPQLAGSSDYKQN